MKISNGRCLMVAAGAVVGLAGLGVAFGPGDDAMDMMDMDPEKMMEMMEKAAKPNQHHDRLKKMVGEWDMVAKFWQMPGAEPDVSEGYTSSKMMLDGRQVVSHVKMDFNMGGETMPFEGVGMMGYDNVNNEYVSVWTDTMMTGHLIQTGTMENGKIAVKGSVDMPMGEVMHKNVYSFMGDDKYMMEFYNPNPATGEMMKIGEIVYTRAAGKGDHWGDHD